MVSEVQFCTTERPQFEFDVATCRTCRLRSKMTILEVATSNLQKCAKLRSFHANLTPPNMDIKENFVNEIDLNPRPLNESRKLNNQA